MIIIEEEDVDKKEKRQWVQEDFEEELTEQEQKYRNAVALMESVDCVVRYEQGVQSLRRSAQLFQALGEYRDSPRRAGECIRLAQDLEETGREKAYQETVVLCDNAVTKMDYRTAISELKRFPDYKDCRERIASCREALTRMANRQMWRNRGITLGVLVILLLAAWISPLKPYAEGVIHMKQGRYSLAVTDFKTAGNFLNSITERKKCRYHQAKKAYDNGNLERAQKLCRKAWGYSQADELLTRIELIQLGQSEVGDVVRFGKGKWLVLSSQGETRTMLYHGEPKYKVYAKHRSSQELSWTTSYIRKWCNQDYKNRLLNQSEKKLLNQVVNDPDGAKTDKLYFLSSQEYQEHSRVIQKSDARQESLWQKERWWLRDLQKKSREDTSQGNDFEQEKDLDRGEISWTAVAVDGQGEQTALSVDEKCALRPVIQISLDTGLLEDENSTGEK